MMVLFAQVPSKGPQPSSNTSAKRKEKVKFTADRAELETTEPVSLLKQELEAMRKELAVATQLNEKKEIKLNAAVAEVDGIKARTAELLRDLDDERRRATAVEEEKMQLQDELQRAQREKDQVVQEKEEKEVLLRELSTENERLEDLLSSSEQSSLNIRQRLEYSEGGLRIPSSDIQLTDKKLGHGSYGGYMRIASLYLVLTLFLSLFRGAYCLLARVPCCGKDVVRFSGKLSA